MASAALSAIDVAVWGLQARLLELPLAALLPQYRDTVPVYGSGGFTSYSLPRMERQLAGWVADGMTQVKMKSGRDPEQDEARLKAARAAVGDAAIRGRPSSSTPQKTVEEMSDKTGIPIPGDEDTEQNRVSGLGPLIGILAGLGTGALLGLGRAAGWRPGLAGSTAAATAAVLERLDP